MERIEIAPDRWTFRTAGSHSPFVPCGVNYTPGWSGWAPEYINADVFDAGRIAHDFARMEELGLNTCKTVFSARNMLPDPQAGGDVRPDPGVMDRVATITDLAADHGIRLIWTLSPDWNGFPAWFDRTERWYGAETREIVAGFWRKFAERFRGDGRILAYSFCVETEIDGWNSPAARKAFQRWAREQHGSLSDANAAWGQNFGSWDEVSTPGFDGDNAKDWRDHPEGTDENESRTNDPFLYDYQLFRERVAFQYMHAQTTAVKEVDPGALCTYGAIQWNPIQRMYSAPGFDGPSRGLEYNAPEIARAVDFMSIHFYPVYPQPIEGQDGPETNLRYLELWARWAYAGKPVLIEEFNMYPAEFNPEWCRRLMEDSRRYASGWLSWTFRNTPDSDDITKVCGLLDESDRLTAWGETFRELAPQVKAWELRREPAARTVAADKRFLLTSSGYHAFIESLMSGSDPVDFRVETNP